MANVHVAEMPDAPSSKLDCVSEIGHWWLCEASTTFDAESLEPNVLVGTLRLETATWKQH